MKTLLLLIIFFIIFNSANSKDLDIFKKQYESGLLTEEEYSAAVEKINNKNNVLENKKDNKKKINIVKKKNKKDDKYFIDKEDFELLEIYVKKNFDNEFFDYPIEVIEFFGKNSNNISRAKKAGTYMSKEFGRSEQGQQRFPGRMIKAMAMYEIFYIDRLRQNKKKIIRYKEKQNQKYSRKKSDIKSIQGLISMNNGRKKMREALGMNLETSRPDTIKKFWYLGEFLDLGQAVKQDKNDKSLNKRKKLLAKYKTSIGKLKDKIIEEQKK